ncbi:MAG: sodium:proton antiporter [Amphritea sp.]|nr:sodium:proton antiporter [Amphritea sp.]
MDIHHLIISFLILLLLSLLIPLLAARLRLPDSSLLVLAGFLVSEVIVRVGWDTGIRADNFQSLIIFVLLPLLIFDSAWRFEIPALRANLSIILVLAVLAMVLSAVLTAVGIFYGINHPTGFPWLTALVTGALLVATDPVAVVAQLRAIGTPHRLEVLLEGESLFNDATAIALFGLFLALATGSGEGGLLSGLTGFVVLFFGGSLVGAVFGVLGVWLLKRIQQTHTVTLLSLLIAYCSFYIGEHFLHVSGIMATLIAGLLMGEPLRRRQTIADAQDHTFSVLALLANNLVFLLMGVTITVVMFEQRWLAMLIAIGAVLLARFISVWLGIWIAERLPGTVAVPVAYKPVMIWGGLRGAVTIALALSLPTTLEGWWTVQSIAFGVVLFSLWVQAPSNPLLMKKLL